ncbi:MAG: cupin domain-containing protein [Paracoccaceae bacterium]|nr:cupin domain-containing protein [Paracoccaceae bacterium]
MPADRSPTAFATKLLPAAPDTFAPDGSEVRLLLSLSGGSAAHFRLDPGSVSRAGRHRTVEEIWYILEGCGTMWRRDGTREEIVRLAPGICLTIPLGTSFQFRADTDTELSAFAVTMPPWPDSGNAEWIEVPPYWPVSS